MNQKNAQMIDMEEDYYHTVIRFPPGLWTIFGYVFPFVCAVVINLDSKLSLMVISSVFMGYGFMQMFFACMTLQFNYQVKVKSYNKMNWFEKVMIGTKTIVKDVKKFSVCLDTLSTRQETPVVQNNDTSDSAPQNDDDYDTFKPMVYAGKYTIIRFLLWFTYFLGITDQIFVWDGHIRFEKMKLRELEIKEQKSLEKRRERDRQLEENRQKQKTYIEELRKKNETERKNMLNATIRICLVSTRETLKKLTIKLLEQIPQNTQPVDFNNFFPELEKIKVSARSMNIIDEILSQPNKENQLDCCSEDNLNTRKYVHQCIMNTNGFLKDWYTNGDDVENLLSLSTIYENNPVTNEEKTEEDTNIMLTIFKALNPVTYFVI